ncbi:2-amino-4-hydroxy-6-hydroxymethyldihydropteridine diphosphokinase [Sporosarcina trichiuri]|uniref:2-amino-4-hydroxy-6- hydroxymethyldihydropteridine diphosphokinase n=1 Tax=Sporosarcina trichiuri TaxID=3056445 RepID=UPI0025B4E6E0|nr:2-amino-4-hydroxy-6-hydroxymethyldihydropteridine diphosphokinase [Sporosarcina sp. 0.2-SM1T-5]WJY26707.1 2-amino-4-hydroxy-6-hydroxymethyldihydropteridine diphosphokinase [Sporosarcina sp. 0.2-SM1T-5]
MNTAYLSIGTNMGDREANLARAVDLLRAADGVGPAVVSSIYETAPVGLTEQADFLNVAVRVETSLSAGELLEVCQRIEQELGRVRTVRWGPRTADLDILLYNEERMDTETLTIPHPRMHERAFVLIPLAELAPDVQEPGSGRLYREMPAAAEGGVRLWKAADTGWNGKE